MDDGRDALDLIEEGADTGDLGEAREAVGMLVTRDTSQMDAAELRRTLAETVSENLGDGFFAPLFYVLIFKALGRRKKPADATAVAASEGGAHA